MILIGTVKCLSDDAIMWFRYSPKCDDTSEYFSAIVYPKLYPTYESAVSGNEDYLYEFNTCKHNLEDVVLYLCCTPELQAYEFIPTSRDVKACRCPECMMIQLGYYS